MRLSYRLAALAALLVPSSSCTSAIASPGKEVSVPAPPISTLTILQAGHDGHTSWAALRGKLVVLEFWATWCAPCLANLPHLNALAGSFDPGKVRFISITDEPPALIKAFLTKRKIAGWVAIDRTGATFRSYKIRKRPTTVLVRDGRILAVTTPELLTRDRLAAMLPKKIAGAAVADPRGHGLFLLASAPVRLGERRSTMLFRQASLTSGVKPPVTRGARAAATPPTKPATASAKPLVAVSLSQSRPGTAFSMMNSPDSMEMLGATPERLLTWLYDLKPDRLVWTGQEPTKTYDLHASLVDGSDKKRFPLIRAAIEAGLGITASLANQNRQVLVLRATDRTKGLLTPTISSGFVAGYWQGNVHIINGSMGALAGALETAFHQPVVDATGISGGYDLDLPVPQGDATAGSAALSKALGLYLTKEERSVPVLVLTPSPNSPDRRGGAADGGAIGEPVNHSR